MPAPIASRDVVLERLTQAFRRHGYDAASLARLSDETGLVKASLYHHFPGGKQDMARAVLDSAGERFAQLVLAPLATAEAPRARLTAMARGLDAFYAGGREPCLLGLMTVGEGRERLGPEVRRGLSAWIEAVAVTLEDAGLPREESFRRAQDAVAAVQGALVLARGLDDPEPFRRAAATLPDRLLA